MLSNDQFTAYAEQYMDTVYRVALHDLRSPSHAEDVTQNVFLKLLKERKPFENDQHVRSWLIRVTINACKDILKSSRFRRTVPLEEAPQAAPPPEGGGVLEAVAALPPKYRWPVYLHYIEGYTAAEIGQLLGCSRNTVLSRLNAFLDSELEQVLCFDSAIDAESFASKKSAIFLILPEEDPSKNFMAGLMIQTLSRELFAVAEDNDGKLKNRVVLFCDELGTMPPFDILPLFSAGRSRRLTLVPIIQSLAQLEKNYGKEGSEIIRDNCQDTIFGGFAPGSQTAEVLSKALGSRTVQVGSVSQSKHDPSRSLQMVERPLMTADELRSIPKGSFIVMKTGCHPMQTRLRLFLDWGITFEKKGYAVPAHANRKVLYAGRKDLEASILRQRMRSMGPTGAASGKRYRSNERSGSETPPDTPPGSGLKT